MVTVYSFWMFFACLPEGSMVMRSKRIWPIPEGPWVHNLTMADDPQICSYKVPTFSLYEWKYIYIYIYILILIYIYIHSTSLSFLCIYACTGININRYTYIYIYVYAYMLHMYICTYIYIYTYSMYVYLSLSLYATVCQKTPSLNSAFASDLFHFFETLCRTAPLPPDDTDRGQQRQQGEMAQKPRNLGCGSWEANGRTGSLVVMVRWF